MSDIRDFHSVITCLWCIVRVNSGRNLLYNKFGPVQTHSYFEPDQVDAGKLVHSEMLARPVLVYTLSTYFYSLSL